MPWCCWQKISGSRKAELFLQFVYPGSLHCTVKNTQCYNFPEGEGGGREGKKTAMNSPYHQALPFSKCQPREKRNLRSEREMQRNLTHICERKGKNTPIQIWAAKRKHSNFIIASEAGNIYHMLLPPLHKEINPVE